MKGEFMKMAEHPIIFTGDRPTGIIEGRITQTRRIIKFEALPEWEVDCLVQDAVYFRLIDRPDIASVRVKYPYGKVGDTLWVQETWLLNGSGNTLRIQYKASDSEYRPDDKKWCGRLVSKHAPEHINEAQSMWDRHNEKIKGYGISWRSPRFMPKWAARIFLEITNIRVERVQDIDAVEAEAEGIRRPKRLCPDRHDEYILERFQRLWDSINAKRGFGWDKNPWVRVIEFKKGK